MVRVGGGWVALDEFLVKNDPCRGTCLGYCYGGDAGSGLIHVVPTEKIVMIGLKVLIVFLRKRRPVMRSILPS